MNQWALNAYDLAGSKLSVNGREPLMYDAYSDSYNKISNAVNTRNYLSVEILKDCFVKLYSFILTLSGEVLTDREKNNIRAFIDSKIEFRQ